MPTFYHYTGLFQLSGILREGLSRGSLARRGDPTRQAVSLTTQPDPDGLRCWGREPRPDRTAVRLVCVLDEGDARLEPARTAFKRLHLDKGALGRLDPLGQAKWWSFYHDTVPPDRFTVQLRGRAGYVEVAPETMARLLGVLAAEHARYEASTPLGQPWAVYIDTLDPQYQEDWLLREAFPADRFGLAAGAPPGAGPQAGG